MPEIKNNFLQAKMNKDLDARLIDNGQYRDAQNIVISRSEGDSVGTVQNILGNSFLSDFGVTIPHLKIIGFYANETRDEIYFFATNYSDASSDNLSNFAPNAATCAIYCYQKETNSVFTLVQGSFLNLSKTHPIGGVDVVENLLFWTDNRNQPRKINITTALSNPNYYTKEDHVSVPKYYPFKPISLYKEEVTSVIIVNGGQDYGGLTLPYQIPASGLTGGTGEGLILTITSVSNVTGEITGIEVTNPGIGYTDGDTLILSFKNPSFGTGGKFEVNVAGISTMKNRSDEFLAPNPNGQANPNPDYNSAWPGDSEYLKERFARFGYRFKYVDGEYSLISPFTQAAFVPQNDGYFLDRSYNPTTGALIDQAEGYNSDQEYAYRSTVNRVMRNKIDEVGLILHAPDGIASWSDTISELKLEEIDIIYSEDGSNLLYVLDTISNNEIANTNISLYEYIYQSRKPIKTLPESESIRTSDVAPVRAQTLSTAGNRVIYSNFYNKHTSPQTLAYNTTIQSKPLEKGIEYQNHTIKQNRNYQLGIVLSDRYGRQSDVILSSVDDGETDLFLNVKGSTVYNDYRTPNEPLDTPIGGTWTGEALSVVWNNVIPSTITQSGYPGLYDEIDNPLGWYSYKVVVKQNQQEYYNVYLPSIMNAYPNNPLKELNKTAHISLFGDNINKVPKDLVDVGPEANKFRSSVNLWGRVTNSNINTYASKSTQFYPTKKSDFVNTIATVKDLNIGIYKFQEQNCDQTLIDGDTYDTFILDGRIPSGPEGIVVGGRVSAISPDGVTLFDNAEVIQYSYVITSGQDKTRIKISPSWNNGTGADIDPGSTFTFDPSPFYNAADNPLIGRISTIQSNLDTTDAKNIGTPVDFTTSPAVNDDDFFPIRLAVYETEPVFSNLDIYWETSTSGLIADLNQEILDGDTSTIFGYSDPQTSWFEDEGPDAFVTAPIYPIDANGNNIIDFNASFTLDSVTLPAQGGITAPSYFVLVNNSNGSFTIKTNSSQVLETIYYGQDNLSGLGVLRLQITSVVNFQQFTSSIDVNLSNIVPSWTYNTYPADTFIWTDGPTYPTGTGGNQPPYLGSLIGYGFYGAAGNSPWDGVSCSGKTDGEVTNGTFIPNLSGYQTKELQITNLFGTLISQSNNAGFAPPFLVEQGTGTGYVRAVPALAGPGCGFDNQDLSTTGLGIIIGYKPSKADPLLPAYVTYRITFRLTDGGGLFEQYEIGVTLTTT
jgi:hypothetical protein